MVTLLVFNLAVILILVFTGSDDNIQSRTEREEEIINKYINQQSKQHE